MKERSLRSLFGRIVLLGLPLTAQAACGGEASGDGGTGGGEATGGAGTTGGVATTGGSSATGGTTGGADCKVSGADDPTNCTSPRSGQVPRSCVSAPLDQAQCMSICGWGAGGLCRITAEGPELVTLECPPICVAGRRPPAFIESRSSELGLGAYFARAAELEAASIVAFRGLRAELRAFGAPRRLLRALSRAARDEQRHARATRALARRFGARAQSVRVLSVPARSLEALATENGAEGCVRELYGALSATFQAWNAQDLQVKGALARIAREETRHAALSLSLQRWLAERLSPAARARVRDAQCRAVATLRIEIETQRALPESEVAGLPSTEQALRLFQSLSSVWAESVSPSAPG